MMPYHVQHTGVARFQYTQFAETYPLCLPPLPEQRAIAATLGALDDKIELNRKMNATLEAMARALFRDWFVDFGPTRAKMAGRPPYLSPDLWSLFPARLDADGKPEGWEEKPLDEVANFLNGLALQKFPAKGEVDSLPVIKIAELRNGITANSNRAARNLPPQYIVQDGDFLFSWSGSLLAKFWTGGEGALNQHLFKVTSERYPAWFYSEWVQHHLGDFQVIAASKATTLGHIQRGHLKAAKTICPPDDTIAKLGEVVAPLVDRIVRNELESRTLAQTRDLLLPRLMSGEVRVAEAERVVEEVL
jgi:type I restriction enzyme S subunit